MNKLCIKLHCRYRFYVSKSQQKIHIERTNVRPIWIPGPVYYDRKRMRDISCPIVKCFDNHFRCMHINSYEWQADSPSSCSVPATKSVTDASSTQLHADLNMLIKGSSPMIRVISPIGTPS